MKRLIALWSPGFVFIVILIFAGVLLVQYQSPFIIGADGNLHEQFSLIIREKGFLQSVPQFGYSWFGAHFSDKDFLYHLYLIPFLEAFGRGLGTKIAAAIAATGLMLLTVRLAGGRRFLFQLAAVGALFLSSQFLRDTAEARPLVFAMCLSVAGTAAALKGNRTYVFLLSLLYGATHLSAWTLPLFVLCIVILRRISGKKSDLGGVLPAAFLGYFLSFFIHPNFPRNIHYFFLNGILVPWYALSGSVLELGAELFPLTTRELVIRFPLFIPTSVLMVSLAIRNRTSLSRETAGWGIAFLLFFFMGLVSRRNLTHAYPFFIIFIGYMAKNIGESMKGSKISGQRKAYRIIAFLLFAVCLFVGIGVRRDLNRMMQVEEIYSTHYHRIADALESNISPGSTVFHANWSDSQYLFGIAPGYRYIMTLDPIYMYSYDPQLYAQYRSVSFGSDPDPYAVISGTFSAGAVYAGKNYFSGFIRQLEDDSRFRLVYEDEVGVLYKVEGGASGMFSGGVVGNATQ